MLGNLFMVQQTAEILAVLSLLLQTYTVSQFGMIPWKKFLGKNWQMQLIRIICSMNVEYLHAHITEGNHKIGRMLNFSLPAIFTCSKEACKTCGKGGCYALKENRYATVIFARFSNWMLAIKDLGRLHREINQAIEKERVRRKNAENRLRKLQEKGKIASALVIKLIRKLRKFLFRLHESGDFFSDPYLEMWLDITKENRDVKFFTYSKWFDRIRKYAREILASPNFNVLLSAWEGLEVPQDLIDLGFGVAYVYETEEEFEQLPKGTHKCPAQLHDGTHCDQCGLCAKKGVSVAFKKH